MYCYNCDNDADMEVIMMINGSMEKVNICFDCYRQQLNEVIDNIQNFSLGEDMESIQKALFKFMRENKVDMDDIISNEIDLENINDRGIDFGYYDDKDEYIKDKEDNDIKILEKNIKKKRETMDRYVLNEEYLKAAILRDEIKNMNEIIIRKKELER